MFALVERPMLYPAATVLGNTAGPVVDLGEMLVGGHVYVDRTEAGEIARHFGFETPEAAKRRDRRIAELEAELADAHARLARIQGLVEAA